jgi:hypothetical protein
MKMRHIFMYAIEKEYVRRDPYPRRVQRGDTVKNFLRDTACCFGLAFGDVLDDACKIFGCRLGPSDAH